MHATHGTVYVKLLCSVKCKMALNTRKFMFMLEMQQYIEILLFSATIQYNTAILDIAILCTAIYC